jgi:hypothetical protein
VAKRGNNGAQHNGDGHTAPLPRTKYSPPELAQMWGRVSPEHIIRLIEKGLLPAVNVSLGRRPRYLISLQDIEQFDRMRAAGPRPKTIRKRQEDDKDVIKFF